MCDIFTTLSALHEAESKLMKNDPHQSQFIVPYDNRGLFYLVGTHRCGVTSGSARFCGTVHRTSWHQHSMRSTPCCHSVGIGVRALDLVASLDVYVHCASTNSDDSLVQKAIRPEKLSQRIAISLPAIVDIIGV